MINNGLISIVLMLLFYVSTTSAAEPEKIEETVLGMNISGNKEAPNILYIIPWKENTADATPPEVSRLMDDIFSTVDPDVYEKEVIFFEQMTEAKDKD